MRYPSALSAACLAIAAAPVAAPAAAPPAKPNILFLLADDLSWEGVRALGGLDIETPNLDRLVGRGTRFTHAYNSGAWHGAVCVASRTMLNTGLQLWDARRAEPTLDRDFADRGRFWSQQMAQAGYHTGFAGKWHVKANVRQIFDHVRNIRPGMPESSERAYLRPVEGRPDNWSPSDPALGGYWKGGKHWSEVLADDCAELIAAVQEQPQPWFICLAFNAPHDPRQSPQEFIDRYPIERVQLPDNYLPEYPHIEAIGAGHGLRDERLAPFPRTPFAIKTHRREYFAAISHLDAQLGRILDALERSGEAASTVVIFTADNGLAIGHHGLLGKQNMYEHSVRVPFVIAGPEIPRNHEIAAPIYLQDAMPTALELAGAPVPAEVAFQSVLPHLRGAGKPRGAIFGAYMDLQRMVVRDGNKLILYPRIKTARLFNLTSDPSEMIDLIGKPESLPTARALFATLRALQQEHHDPLDLTAAFPNLAN